MSEIQTVAVVGAGTMGHGIAQACAMTGHHVRLHDATQAALEGAATRIRVNLDQGIARGKLRPEDRQRTLDGILATLDLEEAVASADLVVEAVPERLELKREVFRRVAEVCRPSTLLATNTSSIAVAEIAAGLPQPGRVLGLHFFNPVHLMELVEMVVAPATDREAVARARRFIERLGKTAVEVKDAPGFATSRLGVALGMEAIRMLEQGIASAEDIDRAMELGYRHPVGPLKLTDLVGLDVRLAIAEYLHARLGGTQFEPPALLRRMVAEGKLGKKSGEGFYRW